MKIRKRMKRTTKQYFLVALICVLVIGGAAAFTSFMITNQIRDEYQGLLNEMNDKLEKNQREVFVAVSDILAGASISGDKLRKEIVYTSQAGDIFLSKDDFGKIAIVDIPSGTPPLKNMLTDSTVASELREVEYNVIEVNSNIVSNDTVDIRIFYPNGENFIVLSKKILKCYTTDTASCFFWVNEEELLRMSAAIVDAALYPGSAIFATKYIEPNIQKASEVTYVPGMSVLKLLETDPNIIKQCSQILNMELRKGLENRLAESMAVDVSAIQWDINREIQPVLSSESALQPEITQSPESISLPESEPHQESAASSEATTPAKIISSSESITSQKTGAPSEAITSPNPASSVDPIPSPKPVPEQKSDNDSNNGGGSAPGELGNAAKYYYYAELTKEGEVEYGD